MSCSRSEPADAPSQAVRLPALPLAGGCQCGAVRLSISAAPLTFYLCHCTRCQRQSGSAFGESLMFPAEAVSLSGAVSTLAIRGGSGRLSQITFCAACGSRLTHRIEGRETLVVKPGTLDDPFWLRPAGEIFTDTRQPWLSPLPGALQYPDAPDMPALHAHWAQMLED